MNRTRIKKIGLLMLGTAIVGWTLPAQAGFEFNAAQAPAKQEALAPEDAIDAPMPIVPTEAVSAEPLDGMAAQTEDHVLKAPGAVTQQDTSEPVYIRRQRSNLVMKADKGQPMDTAALLKATDRNAMSATCRSSMRSRRGAPWRHQANAVRRRPAQVNRSPAAASGGTSVTMTLVAMKLVPQTR